MPVTPFTPLSPIQVLSNERSKVRLSWDYDLTGETKYFNLYWSSRQSGTYVLFGSFQNTPNETRTHVIADIERPVGLGDNFYVTLKKVDFDGVETDCYDGFLKLVYQNNVTLSNNLFINDVDVQLSPATNVTFITTDRFDCNLVYVYLLRTSNQPITVKVTADNFTTNTYDLEILNLVNTTETSIMFDPNEKIYLSEDHLIKVTTTGVSTGDLRIVICRKKYGTPLSINV